MIATPWPTPDEIAAAAPDFTSAERAEIDRICAGAIPLRDYVRQAWAVIEPSTPLVWGWHLDAIADFLEAVANGEIRRLVITMPPRHCKSIYTAVCFPTWLWTFRPNCKFLSASYSHDLSKRDAVRSRRLIQSRWYQRKWGHMFTLSDDQNEKMRYDNDHAGHRIATSVGGVATGEGGDIRLIDDAHKADEAQSDAVRTSDVEWWREVWSSRVTDPKTSAEIIMGQRVHERDIPGVALHDVGGYVHLNLPGRYEPRHRCVVHVRTGEPIAPNPADERAGDFCWSDPRGEPGEDALLWPEQWPDEELTKLEHLLGSYGTASQIQQRPSPAGGGIIMKDWFRFYRRDDLPRAFEVVVQSWDFAFKKTSESSHVAGHVWARLGARTFLLYRDLARRGIVESIAAVRRVSAMFPEAHAKLCEAKANGPAIMEILSKEIPGLIPIEVDGDKSARMRAVSPFVEAGNVWLPHPEEQPWVTDFIQLICSFPRGATTDDGDAMSQALWRLMRQSKGLAEVEEEFGKDSGRVSPGAGL